MAPRVVAKKCRKVRNPNQAHNGSFIIRGKHFNRRNAKSLLRCPVYCRQQRLAIPDFNVHLSIRDFGLNVLC